MTLYSKCNRIFYIAHRHYVFAERVNKFVMRIFSRQDWGAGNPESLGYGNNWWSFSDQLDVVDWVNDAIKNNINVVVSNMATIERLYKRIGMQTIVVDGPKSSKTRKNRAEVIAWHIN